MSEISLSHYLIAVACAFILGAGKAGIRGIGILAVPVMAILFGSKASTGIVLPILIMGDIFAVWYYKSYAKWKYLFKLLPWAVIGILIGVWLGDSLPEEQFKYAMGSIILISVLVLFWWDRQVVKTVPDYLWFAALMGLVAGFSTMVGNLAGAFVNLYILTMRLPKNEFIATTAWFFFLVNWFKVPFHIWVWGTITVDTFMLNLMLLPGIVIGLYAGVKLVRIIKDDMYRQLILWLTAIGAVLIFI